MTQFTDNAFRFDPDAPVLLVKIIRADISVIRLCNDAADLTNADGTYKHIGMAVKAPSNDGNAVSKATIQIANDPSIVTDLNSDNGLERATFILMEILRADPNNPLTTLSMTSDRIGVTLDTVSVELAHKDLYNKNLVNKVYNFSTAPGLY